MKGFLTFQFFSLDREELLSFVQLLFIIFAIYPSPHTSPKKMSVEAEMPQRRATITSYPSDEPVSWRKTMLFLLCDFFLIMCAQDTVPGPGYAANQAGHER